jgi:WhiB family redox-sensing transcriptional regulator
VNPFVKPEPWMNDAACEGADLDLFFPTRGEATKAAVAYCNACPVKAECLEYALDHFEHHGIWGGVSERARRTMRRNRRTGAA